MLDTNLINVENIKATVVKIKEWVQELYPFSYIGGVFNIYNNKNKDHTIINSAGNGNLNIWSQTFNIKSVITALKAPVVSLDSSSSSIRLDSNRAKIIGNDSATVGYDDGTSKCSYAKVSKADGTSILNAREDAKYSDSHGNTLTFKDGDIILKDADNSDGCLYLGVDKSLVRKDAPYAIYNGRLPNGYINSGDGTGQYLYSSTSFGGWTATDPYLVERDLYSGGTYIITASLKSDEALGDGKRVAIAAYLETGKGTGTYTQVEASKQIISMGAATYGGAQCTCVVEVPRLAGLTDALKLQIRGFQSSGERKKFTATIHCTKVS